MTISVAIVEDHAPTRELWSSVLSNAEGFRCVGKFESAEAAISMLPGIAPDVVLVDINLPGLSGIECARQLKLKMPNTQFVMVTAYADANHIFDALSAGATGYLMKSTGPEELLDAIREVQAGGSPMSTSIARKVVQSFQPKESPSSLASTETSLTAREREVLDLLVKGDLYKEIADTLKISVPTVSTHIRKIYEKIHVRSRAQAVARYVKMQRPCSP
jgi:DNA-binding NarL/FixJ family response regulator